MVPRVELGKLREKDDRLNRVEFAIDAKTDVFVLDELPVRSVRLDRRCQLGAVGRDASTVARRRKIFARMKAKAARSPESADAPAMDDRTVGLRGIFNDR